MTALPLPGSLRDLLAPGMRVTVRTDDGIDWDNFELAQQRPGGIMIAIHRDTDQVETVRKGPRTAGHPNGVWVCKLSIGSLHVCGPVGSPDCPHCPRLDRHCKGDLADVLRAIGTMPNYRDLGQTVFRVAMALS